MHPCGLLVLKARYMGGGSSPQGPTPSGPRVENVEQPRICGKDPAFLPLQGASGMQA